MKRILRAFTDMFYLLCFFASTSQKRDFFLETVQVVLGAMSFAYYCFSYTSTNHIKSLVNFSDIMPRLNGNGNNLRV